MIPNDGDERKDSRRGSAVIPIPVFNPNGERRGSHFAPVEIIPEDPGSDRGSYISGLSEKDQDPSVHTKDEPEEYIDHQEVVRAAPRRPSVYESQTAQEIVRRCSVLDQINP